MSHHTGQVCWAFDTKSAACLFSVCSAVGKNWFPTWKGSFQSSKVSYLYLCIYKADGYSYLISSALIATVSWRYRVTVKQMCFKEITRDMTGSRQIFVQWLNVFFYMRHSHARLILHVELCSILLWFTFAITGNHSLTDMMISVSEGNSPHCNL